MLTEHRRRRLDEALRLARGAVRALEEGGKAGDADALTLASDGLQAAARIASRTAVALADTKTEPARRLKPMPGGRRAPA